MKHFWM